MPDSRFTHANGINIHYLDWRGSGPTVVCVPGITSQAHVWDEVAEQLSPQFRVIAIDQRGHGDSEKPNAGYRSIDFVADLDAFVQSLGITKFALIGHSLGGRVVGLYSVTHPERLSHLIMEDPAFPTRPATPDAPNPILAREERRPAVFSTLDDAIAYVATETDSGDTRTHAERWTEEQLSRRTENMMRQRADGAWEWKYSQRAILEIMEQRRIRGEDPILENASRVTCPVLLIRGADSKTCTPENAKAIQNAFPNCRTVSVPDVSHGIHMEKLAEFMAAVNEFLR